MQELSNALKNNSLLTVPYFFSKMYHENLI